MTNRAAVRPSSVDAREDDSTMDDGQCYFDVTYLDTFANFTLFLGPDGTSNSVGSAGSAFPWAEMFSDTFLNLIDICTSRRSLWCRWWAFIEHIARRKYATEVTA